MAAVIDLVSSDDEDEPVVAPTRPAEVPNSSTNPQRISPHPQATRVAPPKPDATQGGRAEKDGGTRRTDAAGPSEEGDQRGVAAAAASCSTSDQARDLVGVQTERRAKMGAGGKGKSAVGGPTGSTPGASTQDKSICRHFWQAGDYEAQPPKRRRPVQGAMDHVRVHPKFLHSNATSHKWALGAVAELLDNAIDEIQNGATYVRVDKITNPRDGSPALLVQDDGGGMSPDDIRQCMSLGYSRKNTNTTIGQYGNGFKTSTMRLGADVIVLTRNGGGRDRVVTQSVGLLSYTFLRKTGHEDIVVPMVDYQLSSNGVKPSVLLRTHMEDWLSNLSTIMRWSPYSSEEELLRQFDDIGWHGTKVIVFNLWLNDDGILELDFDSDEHDIQLRQGSKEKAKQPNLQALLAREHISNRYRLSLRVYASILYLHMPQDFQIILRGEPVEHHSIALDLKFMEFIVYKPQIGSTKDSANKEASVITTIGFTKEAPMINVHGFNVYHKNRLIMPFWKVFQENSSRGRGVVGVLEANFIEPAHDKQDFERTAVFLRLESRLKAMTIEYWNLHCQLIGYKTAPRVKASPHPTQPISASAPDPLQRIHPSTALPVNTAMATSSSPTSSSSSGQPIITHENKVGGLPGQTAAGNGDANGIVDQINNPASTAASAPSTPPRAGVEDADGASGDRVVERSGSGGAPLHETLVQRTGSSNIPLGTVKAEVREDGDLVKRQRAVDDLVPVSKRQRKGGDTVPLATREDGEVPVSPENGALLVEVLEQNTVLRQKCTDYEKREKHWEQKLMVHEQRERDWELKVRLHEQRERDWELKVKDHEQRERDWELKVRGHEQRERDWELKVRVHEQWGRDCERKFTAVEKGLMEHKLKYTKLLGQMALLTTKNVQANQGSEALGEASGVVKAEPEDAMVCNNS